MRQKNCFCGWYFKCQSEEGSVALIPAVHTQNGQTSCSIQLITDEASWSVALPSESYRIRRDRPYAQLDGMFFSEDAVFLDIRTESLSVLGSLQFGKPSPIRFDIMGPFCCVPFLECRHRVFSMRHEVNGMLHINGKAYCFKNGVGYIEGDRGCSFPRQYVWTQCCFDGGSLMLAAAEIPLGSLCFTGVIGVIQLHGKEYRLATYLGARILRIQNREIVIRQGDLTMTAALLDPLSHPLMAPAGGAMTRIIREHVACRARYQLRKKGRVLFDLETEKASFEYEYR